MHGGEDLEATGCGGPAATREVWVISQGLAPSCRALFVVPVCDGPFVSSRFVKGALLYQKRVSLSRTRRHFRCIYACRVPKRANDQRPSHPRDRRCCVRLRGGG